VTAFLPYEKPPRTADVYQSTGKEAPDPTDYPTERSRDAAFTYWWFAERIGDEPGMTPTEAYTVIGGPAGLSFEETYTIIRGATSKGFLKYAGKKKKTGKKK